MTLHNDEVVGPLSPTQHAVSSDSMSNILKSGRGKKPRPGASFYCEFPECGSVYSTEHSRRQHYRRRHGTEWASDPSHRRRSLPGSMLSFENITISSPAYATTTTKPQHYSPSTVASTPQQSELSSCTSTPCLTRESPLLLESAKSNNTQNMDNSSQQEARRLSNIASAPTLYNTAMSMSAVNDFIASPPLEQQQRRNTCASIHMPSKTLFDDNNNSNNDTGANNTHRSLDIFGSTYTQTTTTSTGRPARQFHQYRAKPYDASPNITQSQPPQQWSPQIMSSSSSVRSLMTPYSANDVALRYSVAPVTPGSNHGVFVFDKMQTALSSPYMAGTTSPAKDYLLMTPPDSGKTLATPNNNNHEELGAWPAACHDVYSAYDLARLQVSSMSKQPKQEALHPFSVAAILT